MKPWLEVEDALSHCCYARVLDMHGTSGCRVQEERGDSPAGRFRETIVRYKPGNAAAAIKEVRGAGLEVLYDYTPGSYLKCRRRVGDGVLAASSTDQKLEKQPPIEKVLSRLPDVSIPQPKKPTTTVSPTPPPTGPSPTNDVYLAKQWGLRFIRRRKRGPPSP